MPYGPIPGSTKNNPIRYDAVEDIIYLLDLVQFPGGFDHGLSPRVPLDILGKVAAYLLLARPEIRHYHRPSGSSPRLFFRPFAVDMPRIMPHLGGETLQINRVGVTERLVTAGMVMDTDDIPFPDNFWMGDFRNLIIAAVRKADELTRSSQVSDAFWPIVNAAESFQTLSRAQCNENVYFFVSQKRKFIKCGVTNDLNQRLRDARVWVADFRLYGYFPGDEFWEKHAHRFMHEFAIPHFSGENSEQFEWEALSLVNEMLARTGQSPQFEIDIPTLAQEVCA